MKNIGQESLHKKMKFSIKDFFSKFDQTRRFFHIYWKSPERKTSFFVQE